MGYLSPAPVWHASICYHGRRPPPATEHFARAVRAVQGVGDATLGEWVDIGDIAVHYRRRLSVNEQLEHGLVVRDVRDTEEAEFLLDAVRAWLPPGYSEPGAGKSHAL